MIVHLLYNFDSLHEASGLQGQYYSWSPIWLQDYISPEPETTKKGRSPQNSLLSNKHTEARFLNSEELSRVKSSPLPPQLPGPGRN